MTLQKHFLSANSLTIAVFLLSLPTIAFATSGACSSHGGVDCAAGAGAYGQVICSDGWEGSSVSYTSMEECQPSQSSLSSVCPLPPITGCTEEFEYTQMQDLCTQEQQLQQQNCARTKAYGLANGEAMSVPQEFTNSSSAACNNSSNDTCKQASECQAQITSYNASQQAYSTCVSDYEKQSEQAWNAAIQQSEHQLQQSITEGKQLSLNASCGANQTYDQTTNQCECADGNTYINGECMTPDKAREVQAANDAIAAQAVQLSKESQPLPSPAPKPVPTPLPIHHATSIKSKVDGLLSATETQTSTSAPPNIQRIESEPTTTYDGISQPQATIPHPILHKLYQFFLHLFNF